MQLARLVLPWMRCFSLALSVSTGLCLRPHMTRFGARAAACTAPDRRIGLPDLAVLLVARAEFPEPEPDVEAGLVLNVDHAVLVVVEDLVDCPFRDEVAGAIGGIAGLGGAVEAFARAGFVAEAPDWAPARLQSRLSGSSACCPTGRERSWHRAKRRRRAPDRYSRQPGRRCRKSGRPGLPTARQGQTSSSRNPPSQERNSDRRFPAE